MPLYVFYFDLATRSTLLPDIFAFVLHNNSYNFND